MRTYFLFILSFLFVLFGSRVVFARDIDTDNFVLKISQNLVHVGDTFSAELDYKLVNTNESSFFIRPLITGGSVSLLNTHNGVWQTSIPLGHLLTFRIDRLEENKSVLYLEIAADHGSETYTTNKVYLFNKQKLDAYLDVFTYASSVGVSGEILGVTSSAPLNLESLTSSVIRSGFSTVLGNKIIVVCVLTLCIGVLGIFLIYIYYPKWKHWGKQSAQNDKMG